MYENKPWAILKVTRKQYCAARPWTRAGMTRKRYEELLSILPEGMVEEIHREADAQRLIAAAFGIDAAKE